MKRVLLYFICVFVAVCGTASGITINKAPAVATKQASAKDTGATLLPTVLNLVSGVTQLNQKQKQLTADCIPTSQEIQFVNNIIKEWAKTGAATAEEIENGRMNGMRRCSTPTGGYEESVRLSAELDDNTMLCYDYYGGEADKDTVWENFPKAVSTYYCTDGEISGCSEKNRNYVSNIYDVFNLVDFSESDYTKQEAKIAGNLIAKIEQCSYSKLNAKKKALWGEFLIGTVGSLGQKTNTANIMETISGMSGTLGGGGGAMQSLQSLSGIATQFLAQ